MDVLIIILCIVVAYFIFKNVASNKSNSDNSIKEIGKNQKIYSGKISIDERDIQKQILQSSAEEKLKRKKRRDLLYSREARRKSKDQVWIILRYMVSYKNLLESSNFYNFKKNLEDYKVALDAMENMHPNDYSFNVAFRFCQMEHHIGLCTHTLTNEEIFFVRNWKDNNINIDELLHKVLESYKSYWNNVLHSYVRQSARTKRLQYIVDDLDNIMTMPDIKERPIIIDQIKKLQMEYQSQLN